MVDDPSERRLGGLYILVAEDDHIQCDGMFTCIVALDALVVGPAHDMRTAQSLVAARAIDLAIIDIDLGDDASFDLADALHSRRLPFIFATGHNCRKIPDRFAHIACQQKPFTEHALVRSLALAAIDPRH